MVTSMANQREKSKRQVGFYATPEEKKAIEALAKARGISVSELLRAIATGSIKVSLLAFSAIHLIRNGLSFTPESLLGSAKAGIALLGSIVR